MKKKIRITLITTVVFAIIILTASLFAIVNVKEIEETKDTLSICNDLFIASENYRELDLSKFHISDSTIRFSVIDKEGNVVFDTEGQVEETHIDREEVQKAFINGEASSVRYSNTLEKKMVYYATKFDDNYVVRSSVDLRGVSIFSAENYKYFGIIIVGVIVLTIILAEKLVKVIIYPVKDLEEVTTKIAGGELNKRAKIYNKDEIGSLANTFNEMANQLQIKINDGMDKQVKLEAILESMESGVIAISQNMKVMLINTYAKDILGIRGEVIGKDIEKCLFDSDVLKFILNYTEIDAKEIKLYYPYERNLRVKKSPIISGNQNNMGIVVSVQDITDIKRLENIRSEFVANVSHELKTPLTSIKGFSETLRFVEDDETKNKFLDIIDKETERLSLLINDILILSNIENMDKMERGEFSPDEVIGEAIDIMQEQAEKKNINIIFNDEYGKMLNGDHNKFYQIALNLLTNAIKYSDDNSNVWITTKDEDKKFIMIVKDEGIGMPEDALPRIFERFYRVDKSRATRGTGLGLAIVKHIIKLFNGDIFVESIEGKGSTFTVVINNNN